MCEENTAAIFAYFANLLSLAVGLVFILVGVIVLTELDDIETIASSDTFRGSAIGIIVLGCLVALAAVFGCFGVYVEDSNFLQLHIATESLLVLLQLSIGIYAFVDRARVKDIIEDEMQSTLTGYRLDGEGRVTDAWDSLQQRADCCGVTGVESWAAFEPDLPDSCCVIEADDCGRNQWPNRLDEARFYQKGCVASVEDMIRDNIDIIVGCSAGVLVLQVGIVVVSCQLYRHYFNN